MRILVMVCLAFCIAGGNAWGAGCNLKGGGKWWKGLSVSGVNMRVTNLKWNGGDSGTGWYDVSLFVSMDQGVKEYYSAVDGWNWYRENLPAGVLGSTQENCHEGNVVTGHFSPFFVGGGVITPSLPGIVGSGNFQLLNNSTNLGNIAKLQTPPGIYMVGLAGTSYSDTWTGRIQLRQSGVLDGTYFVNVPIGISGVSVWFASGSNAWDRVNGSVDVPPPVMTINLPLTIRISGGAVVDPNISCNFVSGPVVNLDHGSLRKDVANGNEKISTLKINCNEKTSGTLRLQGNVDSSDMYSVVNMGKDISSKLSLSKDNTSWGRVLSNFSLASGSNTIYFKSTLNVGNDMAAGAFNGSAIGVFTYN